MLIQRLNLYFPYVLLAVVVAVIAASNIPKQTDARAETAGHVCQPCGMDVDGTAALRGDRDGEVRYYCSPACLEGDGSLAVRESPAGNGRLVDVVCQMEVNSSWGIQSVHEGAAYFFCTRQCKKLFDGDPEHWLIARCLVCQTPLAAAQRFPATYLGQTYELCSDEHRRQFKADPAAYFMHTMWGIPTWLYYGSIAIVLLVSFGVFDWLGRRGDRAAASAGRQAGQPKRIGRDRIKGEGERLLGEGGLAQMPQSPAGTLSLSMAARSPILAPDASVGVKAGTADRLDLLSIGWIRAALGSRLFRFGVQAGVALIFLLIVAAGLLGNQNPALNIAPILTWTVWWGLLVILVLFAGKAWCYVCPWDALAGWTERLALWKKKDDGLTLGWKWPQVVRNISIATILFVGLTWVELGFGVTMKPRMTAYIAIAMLVMAVLSAMLFNRKSFCRYGCLVGRVSGLYALFASTEVRPRSRQTCKACRGKECVTGSSEAYACPTFLNPARLETNTYCIQCMECVQACPHDNLALNLRPWGSDLAVEGKPRSDEAYLALLMLAITGFHGLTMTAAWREIVDGLRGLLGFGRMLGFSFGMFLLMVGPIVIYAALADLSKRLAGRELAGQYTYREYFVRYAYALLPIALFYHIAHNLEHLLMEGPKVLALLSDPFGWQWNLFGTAGWVVPPLISLDKLWLVQVLLVLVGHVYSLWAAQKTSIRMFGSARAAFRSQLPMLIGMIAFSVFSLWLLKQPMEMRTSAM